MSSEKVRSWERRVFGFTIRFGCYLELMGKLENHKAGITRLYIHRLDDVEEKVLRELMAESSVKSRDMMHHVSTLQTDR